MSPSEKLSEPRIQGPSVLPSRDQGQKQDQNCALLPAGQGTRRNEILSASLQNAMQELVKAQDHLHSASDQGRDAISQSISRIIQNLRGLQREVSNVIHLVSCEK